MNHSVPRWPTLFLAAGLCWPPLLESAETLRYETYKQLGSHLRKLARAQRSLVRLEKLAQTRDGLDVFLAEVGSGGEADRRQRPAFLLVAGIEGNDLAGTASAMAWIEHLTAGYEKEASIKKLLDTTTVYVVPRLNPEAAEHFFTKPKREALVSNRPVDDDKDGLVDEDGLEDLNGDGLITWIRVEDPEGEYVLDPAEPRLLLKADRIKGERGAWRLLMEGTDNDKDEAWNEDGPGGVNFNRNFPFNYKFFDPVTGGHQVSEAESRALADFVVGHPNIGLVFTFGAVDNLIQPPKGEPGGKRPPAAISDDDLPFYRELGKAWRERLGVKKEFAALSEPGSFSDWMYFHRGRLSLAARAWSPALQIDIEKNKEKEKDETEKAKEEPARKEGEDKEPKKPAGEKEMKAEAESKAPRPAKAEDDKRNEEERAILKWFDQHAPEAFVAWKEFAHPDFPGKKVEIGGYAPFAKTLPPEKLLQEITRKHVEFLTELAGKLPRVGIRRTEVKPLGKSVYDVTVHVENTGYLPTALAQGSLTREVHPTRVVLKLDENNFLSGARSTVLGRIEGSGGTKEVRWVVLAKDRPRIEVELISALGGTAKGSIELKEEK
jgi:murein tripeptide amidase MpaA